MIKQIKAYSFRQLMRLSEKEKQQYEIKSQKQKEEVVYGYGRIKEQQITYKKRQYSIIVYRDSKGRFAKQPHKKIVPEKEKRFIPIGKTEYYRASVFAEIPYHQKYYWFGIIKIDKLENINIDDMKNDLKNLLHKELHYREYDWWFDLTYSIEYPKPYGANRVEQYEEKWSKTKK